MTGMERTLAKVSNATAAAVIGMCAGFDRGAIDRAVENAREQALEDEEQRMRERFKTRRKMITYGCE